MENKTMSGILTSENPSQKIRIGNTQVEIVLEDVSSTRAIGGNSVPDGYLGPFYSQGNEIKVKSNIKMAITAKKYGLAQGTYICDVYKVKNTIVLPEDAIAGRILFPNPAGFSDYTKQTEGVNWNLTTTSNDQLSIVWDFYTVFVKYNLAGQTIAKEIPLDGEKIKVPYCYRPL